MKKLILLISIFLLTACIKGEYGMSCKEHKEMSYITGKGNGQGYLNFPAHEKYADIKTDDFIDDIKNLGCYNEVEKEYLRGLEDGKFNPDPVIIIPDWLDSVD